MKQALALASGQSHLVEANAAAVQRVCCDLGPSTPPALLPHPAPRPCLYLCQRTDVKPGNVLLKSAPHDPRGFSVKVSAGWLCATYL